MMQAQQKGFPKVMAAVQKVLQTEEKEHVKQPIEETEVDDAQSVRREQPVQMQMEDTGSVLREQPAQMQVENEQRHEEIKKLKGKVKELRELGQKFEKLKDENAQLHQENEKLKRENGKMHEIKQKNKKLEDEKATFIQQQNAEFEEYDAMLQHVQQQNKKLEEQNAAMQKENVQLKKENEKMCETKQKDIKLKKENEKMCETKQKDIKLKEQNAAMQKENVQLKEQNAAMQKENVQLKKENEKVRETKQKDIKLKEQNAAMQKENVQLKEQNAAMQKENVQLKEENAKLLQQQTKQLKRQLESRPQEWEKKYEQLLSHLLARDTEGQEMLNDPLRPSQVADRWRRFKDQIYFSTYHDLSDKVKDKQECRRVLLEFCQAVYDQCRRKEEEFEAEFQSRVTRIFQDNNAEKEVRKAIVKVMGEKSGLFKLSSKEVDEVTEEAVEVYRRSRTFLADMQTQVLGAIKNRWKKAESQETPEPNVQELLPRKSDLLQYSDAYRNYVTECHALCRLMMMQVPSMHLSFDAVQGSEFNRGHFAVHDGPDAGDITVDQVVLPALLRSRGGKVMEKGLATVKE